MNVNRGTRESDSLPDEDVKNRARLKDMVKSEGRRTTRSGIGKKASPRLSDLIRRQAMWSEKGAPVHTPSPERLSDIARKDGPGASRVQSGGASIEARPERAGLRPKESSRRPAAIERQRGSERIHPGEIDTSNQVFQKAVGIIGEILRAVRADAPISISSVEEAADGLAQNLLTRDDLLVHLFAAGDPSPDPPREAVNVCIVAAKFGLELGYSPEELRRLSLAALLHDIGMARLPEGLIEKNGALNPVERATLGRHPEEGAQIVRVLGREYTWLAEVISQVHERVDGSGYPQVLKGEEIHEFAQVVGLADVYESLVHDRPHRKRLSPLDALKEILQRERAAFPDRVLKALIQAFTPYPVGSLVRLNTNEVGRVVAKNQDRPLRPVVAVLFRGGKRLDEPAVIDLGQSPLLNIQESLVEEE